VTQTGYQSNYRGKHLNVQLIANVSAILVSVEIQMIYLNV
jgi:hypothetical protein